MQSVPILITNPTNIRYLTGFTGLSPAEREAYVLLTDKAAVLFTNALYRESAAALASPTLSVKEISRENPIARELAAELGSRHIRRIAFEAADLTYAEYAKLETELPGVQLVAEHDRIETRRMIKNDAESGRIREACKLTDDCYSHIVPKLVPGVRESDIAWDMLTFFRMHGAESAFEPIVAFGPHTSQPHYRSADTRLRTNDIVLLDFGARVHGYCADMTRMVFIGDVPPEVARAYDTLLTTQARTLQALNDGERSGSSLDSLARNILEAAGFAPYPHSLGHALGLDIHEMPRLSVQKDAMLQERMVVTVEPGIYIAGAFGMRIEDTVRISAGGCVILTKSSKNPAAISP